MLFVIVIFVISFICFIKTGSPLLDAFMYSFALCILISFCFIKARKMIKRRKSQEEDKDNDYEIGNFDFQQDYDHVRAVRAQMRAFRDGQEGTHIFRELFDISQKRLYDFLVRDHENEFIQLLSPYVVFPPTLHSAKCDFHLETYHFLYYCDLPERCKRAPEYRKVITSEEGSDQNDTIVINVFIPFKSVYIKNYHVFVDNRERIEISLLVDNRKSFFESETYFNELYSNSFSQERKDYYLEAEEIINDNIVYVYKDNYNTNVSNIQRIDYDNLSGTDFEAFCADILKSMGYYNISMTKGSGDYGVDIFATKDNLKYAIQCKRYDGNVGIQAVQEISSGCKYYNCDVAVVLTNSNFTKAAYELAQSLNVVLWDRSTLQKYIDIVGGE